MEATVIDVSVPFEEENAFEVSRRAKIMKLGHLEEILRSNGFNDIRIDA